MATKVPVNVRSSFWCQIDRCQIYWSLVESQCLNPDKFILGILDNRNLKRNRPREESVTNLFDPFHTAFFSVLSERPIHPLRPIPTCMAYPLAFGFDASSSWEHCSIKQSCWDNFLISIQCVNCKLIFPNRSNSFFTAAIQIHLGS